MLRGAPQPCSLATAVCCRRANEACQLAARDAEEVGGRLSLLDHLPAAPLPSGSLHACPSHLSPSSHLNPPECVQARRLLGPGLPAVDSGLLDAAKRGLFANMLFGGGVSGVGWPAVRADGCVTELQLHL